jgi:hypothetical protein
VQGTRLAVRQAHTLGRCRSGPDRNPSGLHSSWGSRKPLDPARSYTSRRDRVHSGERVGRRNRCHRGTPQRPRSLDQGRNAARGPRPGKFPARRTRSAADNPHPIGSTVQRCSTGPHCSACSGTEHPECRPTPPRALACKHDRCSASRSRTRCRLRIAGRYSSAVPDRGPPGKTARPHRRNSALRWSRRRRNHRRHRRRSRSNPHTPRHHDYPDTSKDRCTLRFSRRSSDSRRRTGNKSPRSQQIDRSQ